MGMLHTPHRQPITSQLYSRVIGVQSLDKVYRNQGYRAYYQEQMRC
jgi:hypothetical protein